MFLFYILKCVLLFRLSFPVSLFIALQLFHVILADGMAVGRVVGSVGRRVGGYSLSDLHVKHKGEVEGDERLNPTRFDLFP